LKLEAASVTCKLFVLGHLLTRRAQAQTALLLQAISPARMQRFSIPELSRAAKAAQRCVVRVAKISAFDQGLA
jgi:hypothetical protein